MAAGMSSACSSFVRAAALEGVRGAPLRQRAGLAMERCAAAERAPLDDRTALARVFMQARMGAMHFSLSECVALLLVGRLARSHRCLSVRVGLGAPPIRQAPDINLGCKNT